jgi:hypothetical protein
LDIWYPTLLAMGKLMTTDLVFEWVDVTTPYPYRPRYSTNLRDGGHSAVSNVPTLLPIRLQFHEPPRTGDRPCSEACHSSRAG